MEKSLTFDIEADELETFLQDVNEHLQVMEAGILRLEQAADPDTLNSVFRAAHTLKAVAGAVGHHSMAELTHTMETLFDAMREARLSLTQDMADALLAAVDALRALRDEVVSRQPSGMDVAPFLARLRAESSLRGHAAPEAISMLRNETASPPPAVPNDGSAGEWEGEPTPDQIQAYREQGYTIYEINAAIAADAIAPAARLLQAAMALAEAGQIMAQRPSQDDLLNNRHNGRLRLVLATQAGMNAIQELVSDVFDVAEFHVQPYAADVTVQPTGGLRRLSAHRGPSAPGNQATDESAPAAAAVESATRRPTAGSATRQEQEQDKTVRISVERLDALMNLVGELVTDRTRMAQIEGMLRAQYGKGGNVSALDETITRMGQVVDRLQEEVMSARMLPISHLFDKFPRLVRDAARAAGKQVQLVIEGETTELDRSIIEAVGDPLIHLLRNAVDHGIESPQARIAAGKPPTGVVRLTAAHVEGQIVVTVQDDGRGIDPDRIRRAAAHRGVLSEDETARLDDDEAISLIFRPGLSTTDQVTGMSGRGVGLDVVRTNINRIGGSVAVENEVGRGVTFRVTMPLTLAILPTMLVALGDDVYALPLTSIVESLYLEDVTVSSVKGNPAIQWRDQVLPLLNLCQFFGRPSRAVEGKPAVVAVAWGRLQVGLTVDKIIGKQEIVVKPFGSLVGSVPGLSGCTILGNGRIALIIDVPGLINAAMQAYARHGLSRPSRAEPL